MNTTDFKTIEDLVKNIKDINFGNFYKNNTLRQLIRNTKPEEMRNVLKKNSQYEYELFPLLMGILARNKEYYSVEEMSLQMYMDSYSITNISIDKGRNRSINKDIINKDKINKDRNRSISNDVINSLLIKYYYMSIKSTLLDISMLYKLRAKNIEFNNLYTAAQLTNSILDFNISHNIYRELPLVLGVNDSYSRDINTYYHFYMGYIHLVLNELKPALKDLEESEILFTEYNQEEGDNKEDYTDYNQGDSKMDCTDKEGDNKIDCTDGEDLNGSVISPNGKVLKYLIVTKLLMGDYSEGENVSVSEKSSNSFGSNSFSSNGCSGRPYYDLSVAVKKGDAKNLKSVIDSYESVYINDGIYFVIKRLLSNTLTEGIRRISLCYSRIKMEDINEMLGANVRELIIKCIKNKTIKGFITLINNEDVFISNSIGYNNNSTNSTIEVRNTSLLGSVLKDVITIKKKIQSKIEYPEIPTLTFDILEKESKDLKEKFS